MILNSTFHYNNRQQNPNPTSNPTWLPSKMEKVTKETPTHFIRSPRSPQNQHPIQRDQPNPQNKVTDPKFIKTSSQNQIPLKIRNKTETQPLYYPKPKPNWDSSWTPIQHKKNPTRILYKIRIKKKRQKKIILYHVAHEEQSIIEKKTNPKK